MDLTKLTLTELKTKRQELKKILKEFETEISKREKVNAKYKVKKLISHTAPVSKSSKKPSIKATTKVMKHILKANKIEFDSKAKKTELEEIIRKNNLVKKTEMLEAHVKVKST
jgi:hypothetical protein